MSDSSRTVDDVKNLLQSMNNIDSQETMKFYDIWAETYDQVGSRLLIMSDSSRTVDDVKNLLQSMNNIDSQETMKFYDIWAETYDQVGSRLLIMSDSSRTVDDVKNLLQSMNNIDSQETMKFYDIWAETYDQDTKIINYRAPNLGVDLLIANFSGNPEEVQVLDVACGSGLVAKLMVELGFKHFVGVDGSKAMLDQAAKTGLYQDLKLALLGTEKLPAQSDMFDLVILVGGLGPGFIPPSIVRELCAAAKPGGLVCMTRSNHRGAAADDYKKDLERELLLMEEEGLWSPAGLKQTDRYMEDPRLNSDRVKDLQEEERYLSGTVYLYKKSTN